MLDDAIPVLQCKATNNESFSVEVILVDDGSKDATCAEYAKYVKSKLHLSNISFKLLKLPQNCGKGRAVSEVSFSSITIGLSKVYR
jgi:glycosyltransferase involved in cell wall biosynthesis